MYRSYALQNSRQYLPKIKQPYININGKKIYLTKKIQNEMIIYSHSNNDST